MEKQTKDILIVSIVTCIFIVLACVLSGCHGATDGAILKYQQQIDRLEEELRNRDRTVEAAVGDIRSITVRSETMEGTVDELIELFGEYQRRVDKLLYDYNNLRKGIEAENSDNNVDDSSRTVDVTIKNSRRSSVRERDKSSTVD